MKIIQVTNFYRSGFGGEVSVFNFLVNLLSKNGHSVERYVKDSNTITSSFDKANAFFSSIYSIQQKKAFHKHLVDLQPDIVHVHNLYPLLSPSILEACKQEQIPVVMHLHNYSLTCPIGLHYVHAESCDRCLGGREYWGVLRNCTGSFIKSVNYSLRNAVARKFSLFLNNVDIFIAISNFAKGRFIDAGISENNIEVLPNAVEIPHKAHSTQRREFVGFAGRLEEFKGIETVIEAAKRLPHVSFHVAGDGPLLQQSKAAAPANMIFHGRLSSDEMQDFLSRCRFLLFLTRVFEGPTMIILESMIHGIPVIASKMGPMEEVIEDAHTGFLCDTTDIDLFVDKIKLLWNDDNLCKIMGEKARTKVQQEYNEQVYYSRLMSIYQKAIKHVSQSA